MQALPLIFAGLGAAASIAGVVNANKAREDAQRQAAQQKTAAKEAASLETALPKTDAAFQIGLDDPTATRKSTIPRVTKKGSAITGTSPGGISAASVGGL